VPRNDIELTEEQARKNHEAHVKKHGHEMKVPPGQAKKNDTPTRADLDAEFPWEKDHKPRPAHPDD